MPISSTNSLGLGLAALLFLGLSLSMVAKDKTPNTINLQGKVFLIDKDSSTIMVDTKSGARRLVVYGPDTKFKYGRSGKGKESSLNEVKETHYISCTGTSDDRARLVAQQCVQRGAK